MKPSIMSPSLKSTVTTFRIQQCQKPLGIKGKTTNFLLLHFIVHNVICNFIDLMFSTLPTSPLPFGAPHRPLANPPCCCPRLATNWQPSLLLSNPCLPTNCCPSPLPPCHHPRLATYRHLSPLHLLVVCMLPTPSCPVLSPSVLLRSSFSLSPSAASPHRSVSLQFFLCLTASPLCSVHTIWRSPATMD